MPYLGKTTYYGIPIAMQGDAIREDDNVLQMQMIDNLLQAATGIVGTGVIQEGTFLELPDEGSGASILLSTDGGISIKGVLNGGLCKSSSSVLWDGLSAGNFYYLYLKYTDNLYTDSTAFEIVSLTVPVATTNLEYLYMATYDLTGGTPVLDTDPDGKVYTQGFLTHMGKSVDPHSDQLTQTNLAVSGSLNIGLRIDESVTISQENTGSITPLITLSHVNNTIPLLKSIDEFVIQDLRMTTRLSESGETSFDNGKISIVGAINENSSLISANTISIAQNTSDIADNVIDIATNTSDIADNVIDIAQNTSDISDNTIDIATNAADILINTGNIATNTSDIAQNTSDIADNTLDIVQNTSDIADNTSDILTISGDVGTNTSVIAAQEIEINSLRYRVYLLECAVFGCSSSSSSSSL